MKKALVILSIFTVNSFNIGQALATTTDQSSSDKPTKPLTQQASSTPTQPDEADIKPVSLLDGLSGTLALTSNYVFRGVSQTENLPATQGGLTYTFPIGVYFNVWGSNVKFVDTDATAELDTVVGFHGTAYEEAFSYDVNLARYNYPGTAELNYNELNTLFNYEFLQAGVSYSANVYNTHQSGTYYSAGINYGIPSKYVLHIEDINLLALFGHFSLPRAAGNSYNDYNIALSKKINDTYVITGQWTSTNGRQHNAPYDSSQLIGTVTANF